MLRQHLDQASLGEIALDMVARHLDQPEPWRASVTLVSPLGTVTGDGGVILRFAPLTTNSSGITAPVADETKPMMRWSARSSTVRGVPNVLR
jgi:hypothetical protein